MRIILSSGSLPEETLKSGLDLVRTFFPESAPVVLGQVPDEKALSAETAGESRALIQAEVLNVAAVANMAAASLKLTWSLQAHTAAAGSSSLYPQFAEVVLGEQEIVTILAQKAGNRENVSKVLIKHGILRLLSQVTGKCLPWGILSGIRPGKIVQNLLDRGFSRPEIRTVLERYYALRADKAGLLLRIAAIQRPYLEVLKANPRRIALYVGIPFCPSRCSYCSFPAYGLSSGRQELTLYLQALQAEIRACGLLARQLGLLVDNVYIGGGTPTVLTAEELTWLLLELKKEFSWQECREFTVEAGRVDTLSAEKLAVLGRQGVTRLSINPQTMQEFTLRRIGRRHSVAEVRRVYHLARSLKDWIINMDLILGLPGESLAEVQDTLAQIADLQPDNLTVHMLAIKRGSREYQLGLSHGDTVILEQMQELSCRTAASCGLEPYYLYRQKRLAGNLENIGYARPGRECCYNIAIIEERQHILGLGAGASNKIINLAAGKVINIHHPQSWQHYLQKWPQIHDQRRKALAARLGLGSEELICTERLD
jgi:oxygen-independent coproporphyrinogen-3 oxidase